MICTTIHQRKIMKKALEKNGKLRQSVIAMEECSELIKAISKMIRYSYDEDLNSVYRDNLIEEMADVYIILDELKMMYNILEFDIEEMIKRKIDREEGRICDGCNCSPSCLKDKEVKKEGENNEKFRPEGTV